MILLVTDRLTVDTLLKDLPERYVRAGFKVSVVHGGREFGVRAERGVQTVSIPGLVRQPRPLADLVALARVANWLASYKGATIVASTPKAGLIGMFASAVVGCEKRIYQVRGLRYETLSGLRRGVAMAAEWVACRLASKVLCVGESVRRKLVQDGLCPREKAVVLGSGGSLGIDPASWSAPMAAGEARKELGVPDDAFVLGFVGRLAKDKGEEILRRIATREKICGARIWMVVIGEAEKNDKSVREAWSGVRNATVTGWVPMPAKYLPAFDVFVFPSAREGIPNAVLEAGYAGLPVVAFDVTGVRDVVEDGCTGQLVRPGNVDELLTAIEGYIKDADRRAAHGRAARALVQSRYLREEIAARHIDFFAGRESKGREC